MYSHGTSIHLYKYLIYESGNLDASTTISPMETIGNSRNFGIVKTDKTLCLHGRYSPLSSKTRKFCEYFLIFPYFLYFFRLISRLQNYYIFSTSPNHMMIFLLNITFYVLFMIHQNFNLLHFIFRTFADLLYCNIKCGFTSNLTYKSP